MDYIDEYSSFLLITKWMHFQMFLHIISNVSTFLAVVSFSFAWFGFIYLSFFFFLREKVFILEFRRPPASFMNNIPKACLFKWATTCPYLRQAF